MVDAGLLMASDSGSDILGSLGSDEDNDDKSVVTKTVQDSDDSLDSSPALTCHACNISSKHGCPVAKKKGNASKKVPWGGGSQRSER